MPKEKLSDRVDVSVAVLNKHYDTRTEERRRRQRLKLLEKLFPQYGDPDATIDAELLEEDLLDEPRSTLEVDVAESAMANREEGDVDDSSPKREMESDGSMPEDEKPDDSQTTINEFSGGVTRGLHPAVLLAVVGITAGKWLCRRMDREVGGFTSQPGTSLIPSTDRTTEGMAMYVVFLCLVSINLSLIGVSL